MSKRLFIHFSQGDRLTVDMKPKLSQSSLGLWLQSWGKRGSLYQRWLDQANGGAAGRGATREVSNALAPPGELLHRTSKITPSVGARGHLLTDSLNQSNNECDFPLVNAYASFKTRFKFKKHQRTFLPNE